MHRNILLKHFLFSGTKSKGEHVEITWDNPEELDNYINKLQKAAERLTTENRRLRKSHNVVCEKVSTCSMNMLNIIQSFMK